MSKSESRTLRFSARNAKVPAIAAIDVGTPGHGAVAIAQNRHSEADVDSAMTQAERAGAKITKSAQKVFWGGYSGYFADLDGHLWEVAYNPFAELDNNGRMNLPGPPTTASDS